VFGEVAAEVGVELCGESDLFLELLAEIVGERRVRRGGVFGVGVHCGQFCGQFDVLV